MADRAERFVSPLPKTPPCWTCKHKDGGSPTCSAFPGGIPQVILRGDEQHREPFPGDHGIQYERIEEG